METFLTDIESKIRSGGAQFNGAAKRQTIDMLKRLQYELEDPEETLMRLLSNNVTSAAVQVGFQTKVFEKLALKENDSFSAADLAEGIGADPVLLKRFLRYQAAVGLIQQTADGNFKATKTTKNLAAPHISGSLTLMYAFHTAMLKKSAQGIPLTRSYRTRALGPVFNGLPEFLRDHNHQDPADIVNSPFQKAWSTDKQFFPWLQSRPDILPFFPHHMIALRSSTPNCFNFYAFDKDSKDWPEDKAYFVDIGGNEGQQCLAFREAFPSVQGKVVLQDLPYVLPSNPENTGTTDEARNANEEKRGRVKALNDARIDLQPFDFFTPQTIKGAKYYYMRAILHDWPDKECSQILAGLVPAMSEDSVLVIDETLMPENESPFYAAQYDLWMMALCSSKERTKTEWAALLSAVGLELQETITYTTSNRLSLITATKLF